MAQVREVEVEGRLRAEAVAHADLLRTPSLDGYRNLSRKVFEAYEEVVTQYRFGWLVRVDDNNIVQMDRLLVQLAGRPEAAAGGQTVWGMVHKDSIVHRDRMYRNYELDYSAPAYPLFAVGCLHALSYQTAWWAACVKPGMRRFKAADDTTLGKFAWMWLSMCGLTDCPLHGRPRDLAIG
jgi:hypothetical protein